MKIIEIHWDYSTCREISYQEGLNKVNANCEDEYFETHCLDFFNTDLYFDGWEVIVSNANDQYISLKELMLNDGRYCIKEIRKAHNVDKMLKAGAFKWQDKKD